MKKTLFPILVLLSLATACTSEQAPPPQEKTLVTEGVAPAEAFVEVTTSAGVFTLRLDGKAAPLTVARFLKNVNSGFYRGTVFHRIIPGFMIQGGDPKTKDPSQKNKWGTGGPGYTIKAEFNNRKHVRGVVSMARAQDPNSAGSQFFVCVKDSSFLDGQYTAFGRVVRGMDVADAIVSAPRDPRDNPNERIEMKVRVIEPGA